MQNARDIDGHLREIGGDKSHCADTSVASVLLSCCGRNGYGMLRLWNWKTALLSSLMRAAIFFAANITVGHSAALAAMMREFVIRAVFAGYYGGVIESFRSATPRWAASLIVLLILPLVTHTAEFLLHWMLGTPNLKAGIIASVAFTVMSTSFNLFAMRRDYFVSGRRSKSLWVDLKMMPRLLIAYGLTISRLPWKALAIFGGVDRSNRIRVPGFIVSAVRAIRT